MSTNIDNTTVGIVTVTGRLYCSVCAQENGHTGEAVKANANPHNTEACDACGKPTLQGWLDDYLDRVASKAARNALPAGEARKLFNETQEAADRILKGR